MVPSADIKAFLRKYSSIPNAFIDDFHSVYDRSSKDEFMIDLDVVSKWLMVQKAHLKSTLVSSYQTGVDFTVQVVPNKRGRGRQLEKILMTADCFKFLCMRSRTPKAQMVRAYYVELERVMEKYSADFAEKLQERIADLERNQRVDNYPAGKGFIYVIKASEKWDSVYKLGKSKDLTGRLRSYNSGRMDGIDVIHVLETDMIDAVERCCKGMLAERQYRRIKEVYQVDIDIIKDVIKDCARLAVKTHFKLSKPSKQTGGYYMVLDRLE
jgi:hypothetical protein